MNQLLILFFFSAVICNINLCAQEPAVSNQNNQYGKTDTTKKIFFADPDELKIEVRIPPGDILNKYKNLSEFDYDNKLKDKEDWIAQINSWINQQMRSFQYSETYSTILDFVYYGLIIFALIIIVWGLIKGDKGFLFFGKKSNNEIILTEKKEDITRLNFDDLISSAIESSNYKLAVRYLFLKSLRILSDSEIIYLKKEKTNKQYLAEIENKQIADAFKDVAVRFEWIWYGNFPVDEKLMVNSKKEFNKLFTLIKS